jgi:DNA topoisomerase IA
MQGLADAARSRSEADWLVGINGTRAMTAFNSRDGGFFLTTVGRVQTPTLSLVVEREEKIRKFVSRDYWEVHAASTPRPASTWASGSTRSGRRATTPKPRPTACGTSRGRPLPPPCAASPPRSPKRASPPPRHRRCCST